MAATAAASAGSGSALQEGTRAGARATGADGARAAVAAGAGTAGGDGAGAAAEDGAATGAGAIRPAGSSGDPARRTVAAVATAATPHQRPHCARMPRLRDTLPPPHRRGGAPP